MRCFTLAFWAASLAAAPAGAELRLTVYATAGDAQRYLADEPSCRRTREALERLSITGIVLEGRRGDEYVPPRRLAELRSWFEAAGFRVRGGIATVPGKTYGVRQNERLGWLNWEAEKTRTDIATFFRENAAVFDELVVDDFFCTGDTSELSDRARAGRPWAQYRREMLAAAIQPLMIEPARQSRRDVRLIIKYPQWYDRFHTFGYDPQLMSPPFDRVWVGTEVRNPQTQRMGFVQPTQGYINYRWIASIAGAKTETAWFDHIESTAQNVVDQAWQSILAGARELVFFHLGDLAEGHPSHPLIARQLPAMRQLAAEVLDARREGLWFYKPVASEADGNLFVADYLAMLGLPVVPVATWPSQPGPIFLAVQAAADPGLIARVQAAARERRRVIVTPELLRKAGPDLARLAGVEVSAPRDPRVAGGLELDGGLRPAAARTLLQAGGLPLLTAHRNFRVLNIRTFDEADYRATGEWLLPPKPLGWTTLSQNFADAIRGELGFPIRMPAGVAYYRLGGRELFYNFLDRPVSCSGQGRTLNLAANAWAWR